MTFEKGLMQRIHEFDLISLLKLLYSKGYPIEDIRFASNRSITSQAGLIHSVEFSAPPLHQAVIVVNMGLLSAQSPVPSYIMNKADVRDIDLESFNTFIRFFDHILIGDYIRSIYPETDTQLFPDWEMTKRSYLQMMGLRSCSTLHWLCSLAVPELPVRVEKATLDRALRTSSLRLGTTSLGSDAVFGKKTRVPTYGIRVTFFCDSEFTEWREPWAKEIRKRLEELVFPVLRSVGIDIEVMLVIRAQRSWAKLHQESYLGYDKIRGGKTPFRRLRIFAGHIVE